VTFVLALSRICKITHMRSKLSCLILVVLAALGFSQSPSSSPQQQAPLSPPVHRAATRALEAQKIRVTLASGLPSENSGRLLIFVTSRNTDDQEIKPSYLDPRSVWIEAEEVHDLKPGQRFDVEPQASAYPENFSKLPSGDYAAMAVLDVNHDYVYSGLSGGDLRGPVKQVGQLTAGQSGTVKLELNRVVPNPKIEAPDSVDLISFPSNSLSVFWGRPVEMKAAVVLPPSYQNSPNRRYPTMYWTHGFGGTFATIVHREAATFANDMASGRLPEMIYVLLDEHCPGGTHEFADSVNNGPWGKALTEELIPFLEQKYRMDGKPSGRLLNGHSSGGWAVLWLQVAYPEFFGGTWPTSPDPSDFHSFTGPDLLANPPENFYRKPDGSPWMLVRYHGKDTVSLEDFSRQEAVLGSYGGQMASFEWVFSPRAQDGTPQQLFDRETGKINPEVAKAWEKYDVATVIRTNSDLLRPLLQDKIHLTVGTLDTFHLDQPARLLQKTLQDAGIRAEFTYLEGRDHMNLYQGGLMEKITQEMMRVARPSEQKSASPAGTH
jgi:S-formylglutathione hydrolase FrmB